MVKKYCYALLVWGLFTMQYNATLAMASDQLPADAATSTQPTDSVMSSQLDQKPLNQSAPFPQEVYKKQREIAEEKVMQRAWMSSCIVPGWGQAYNGHYKKIPAMYALFLGLGGGAVYNHLEYKKNLTKKSNNQGSVARYYDDVAGKDRTLRDLFLIFMGMVYIGNVIDAYAGASLKTFNLSDDISIELQPQVPTAQAPEIGVGLSLSFKL